MLYCTFCIYASFISNPGGSPHPYANRENRHDFFLFAHDDQTSPPPCANTALIACAFRYLAPHRHISPRNTHPRSLPKSTMSLVSPPPARQPPVHSPSRNHHSLGQSRTDAPPLGVAPIVISTTHSSRLLIETNGLWGGRVLVPRAWHPSLSPPRTHLGSLSKPTVSGAGAHWYPGRGTHRYLHHALTSAPYRNQRSQCVRVPVPQRGIHRYLHHALTSAPYRNPRSQGGRAIFVTWRKM